MINDEDSRLRRIERELYTTDIQPPANRGLLHDHKVNAPEDWNRPTSSSDSRISMSSQPTNNSWFKRIFLASLGFFVIALGIFGFSLLTGNNSISGKNVAVTITTKTFADGGESLPIDITIVNNNKLDLQLATLDLSYPDGNTNDPTAVTHINRDIGTLAVGATHDESFTVQLYGQQGSLKNITADVQFRVAGSNVVYDATSSSQVTIRTSPINLTLNAPASAVPNQQVPLAFSVVGNGTQTLSNTALVVQYPNNFTFVSATPPPTFQNNIWALGNLTPGVNKTITVYGTFSGSATVAQTIRASIGSQNAQNQATLDQVYNDLAQVIPLTASFMTANITLNGQVTSSSTIPMMDSDTATIRIPYKNTLTTSISNAEIHVSLSGNAYDQSRVQIGQGFFDTKNDQIIWTPQQLQDLASIPPGGSGAVSFSISPKQFSNGVAVSNPVINIAVSVLGYDSSGAKQSVTNVDQKTLAINTDLNLLGSTVHYSGPFGNTGPMPIVPNKQTTFTLNWQITNSRNRATGVVVSTTLPTYVDWKNNSSPATESGNLNYNSVTRVLTWNVGDVAPGTGTGGGTKKVVSFQVGITPSTSQSQTAPMLTGPITITGTDGFTGAPITITHRALDTELLNDSSSVGADGLVQ